MGGGGGNGGSGGGGSGNGSVVHRRILGRRLRLMREEFGLTLEEAAPKLDWSTSTLSRIENGQQAPNVHGLRSMLDLYDIGGDDWDELVTLTREVRKKGWWRAFGLDADDYVGYESEAGRVEEFSLLYFSGLLQTREYSQALFAASGMPRTPAQLAEAVAVRAIRQRRLTSAERPLRLVSVVAEPALHCPVGGAAVMRAQLRHVVAAAANPSVTVQVLPLAAGAHAGMAGGVVLLGYEHLGEPDIAYVEHAVGAVQTQKAKDVDRARLVFDRVRSAALGEQESLALIEEVAARL
jgi:transcriptional regulator with XRE-family HTH domain